ncbi:MAG TPA: Gfo/Idh/MocA family oxidoreductase [Acidimicrobiia bacterium]|nr:Gfo/Idh/MocA family oxidoreductase [Acidimicrobiia bacterium]
MVAASSDRPGAVVVGTGFGCRVHVPALRAAGFDVVALVGTDAERTARRAARADVPRGLTALADALDLPGVAAVTIATPPSTHAALAIAAARAGKHVLCEKPFSLDAGEAAAMFAAVEAAGVGHLVGHEFRWAPERAVVARAIADGMIGEPRFASLVSVVGLVADLDAKLPGWWFDVASGGGWLGASGSHVVDQVRVWLGEIESVSATLSVVSARAAVADDTFTIRFRTRSGVDGVLQQTAAGWGPMRGLTTVAGTDGTIWVDGDTAWIADRGGARPLDVPADLRPPVAPAESDDPRHRFTHLELGPYTRLCEVLRCAVDGSSYPTVVPVPTFADGLAEMQVLDAVRRSAAAAGALVPVGT